MCAFSSSFFRSSARCCGRHATQSAVLFRFLIEVEFVLERSSALKVRESSVLERIESLPLLRLWIQRIFAVIILLPLFYIYMYLKKKIIIPNIIILIILCKIIIGDTQKLNTTIKYFWSVIFKKLFSFRVTDGLA